MPGLKSMNGEKRIQFDEASQAFLCEEYYENNFTAYLRANSVIVESSQSSDSRGSPVSTDSEKLFVLKLTKESPALEQEIGDGLIERFLAADAKNKAEHT
jgi:hypothetical protein